MTKTSAKTASRTPRASAKIKPPKDKPVSAEAHAPSDAARTPKPLKGKLAVVVDLISRPEGATSAELQAATGWQPHSVRGAIAGAIKKAGHVVISERADAGRRYRVSQGAQA